MAVPRNKELRLLVRIIARHRDQDPLTIAEKFLDAREDLAEMLDDDDGIGEVGIEARPPKVRPMRKEPEPELPPPPKSALVLPGDPDFDAALHTTEAERRKAKATAPVRLSKVGQPAAKNGQGTLYWTYEDLIREIQEHTPEQLYFTPTNCPKEMKVLAVRNVQAEMGLSLVKLIYANPEVAQGHGESDDAGQLGTVSIDLSARFVFSLFDQVHDFDKAMADIVGQLESLFRPKHRQMTGTVPVAPSVMDSFEFNKAPMRESAEIHGTGKWSTVGPTETVVVEGKSYEVPVAAGSVVDSIRAANKRLGNSGQ